MFVAAVLLTLLTFISFSNSKQDTLVSLHILFRHGERSPRTAYKNDPYRNHSWPGGWDQLTNKGKLEMYDLGLYFRKRYDSFLTRYYFPENIHVQSSYADRCHMSAQLLLAALYPPEDGQIWNKDILWQPIPVHSVSRLKDNKIAVKRPCPSYEKEFDIALAQDAEHFQKERQELYDYLSQHTGETIQSLLKLESLYNTLEIEQINNLTLPTWTSRVFPDKMKDLAALSLAIFTKTDFMKRMHGGVLLTEIVKNMVLKREKKLKPDRKVFLYSGHDLTVVSLMRVLGYNELLKPEFGASVTLEQHNIDGANAVRVLYKKNPYLNVTVKVVNNCNEPCSLDEFQKIFSKYIIDDWNKECQIN